MGHGGGNWGDAGRRFLPRWPTFPVPVLAIIASSSLSPTLWAAAERSHFTVQGGEGAGQGGGSHIYATLPVTPSFFLPLPRSAKAAALHQGFERHRNLHSVCLGPCHSPPIGAQSALLAQSRAKSSNNPSTPFLIKENASKTAPP
jgi:hypothetical protein